MCIILNDEYGIDNYRPNILRNKKKSKNNTFIYKQNFFFYRIVFSLSFTVFLFQNLKTHRHTNIYIYICIYIYIYIMINLTFYSLKCFDEIFSQEIIVRRWDSIHILFYTALQTNSHMSRVSQWSGRLDSNPRLSHTKDSKNGTWSRLV